MVFTNRQGMRKILQFLGVLAIVALACAMVTKGFPRGEKGVLNNYGLAPSLVGIDRWFNSEAIGPEATRGKAVLLEFWSYGCINCIHTLPHLNEWYDKYSSRGLLIVGVHTPEFDSEREASHLEKAIHRYNIKYPVAQDNERSTWNALGNEFWPTAYLINKKGIIVLKHVGEGDYEEIEKAIGKVLEDQ